MILFIIYENIEHKTNTRIKPMLAEPSIVYLIIYFGKTMSFCSTWLTNKRTHFYTMSLNTFKTSQTENAFF